MKVDVHALQYLLRFLCGDPNWSAEDHIAYCMESVAPPDKQVVIVVSGFFDGEDFGTARSLPRLPLKELDGIPILFGAPVIKRRGRQIILYADLVASTFFLISRYEEMVRPNVRDKHGRFPGRESLPYRAGFLDRPVVDEYGRYLRQLLREAGCEVAEPPNGFSHIWLTHDVDIPWEPFSFFSAMKRVGGSLLKRHKLEAYPILNWIGCPKYDPLYKFEAMIAADKSLVGADSIYFLKSGGTTKAYDSTIYIRSGAAARLIKRLRGSGAFLGYHPSYTAGAHPEKITQELSELNAAVGSPVTWSRNHYLCAREPSDFHYLISAGITDDFTMGYPRIC